MFLPKSSDYSPRSSHSVTKVAVFLLPNVLECTKLFDLGIQLLANVQSLPRSRFQLSSHSVIQHPIPLEGYARSANYYIRD